MQTIRSQRVYAKKNPYNSDPLYMPILDESQRYPLRNHLKVQGRQKNKQRQMIIQCQRLAKRPKEVTEKKCQGLDSYNSTFTPYFTQT